MQQNNSWLTYPQIRKNIYGIIFVGMRISTKLSRNSKFHGEIFNQQRNWRDYSTRCTVHRLNLCSCGMKFFYISLSLKHWQKIYILTKYFNITKGVCPFIQFQLKLLDVVKHAQVIQEVQKPHQQIFCEQMAKTFPVPFFRKSF